MLVLIISSGIAIFVSFLCSLAEAILLNLNPLALSRLPAKSAESWRRLKQNIAHPITAILVLNTIAHTGGATIAGGTFTKIFGEDSIWIFSILFTAIILLGTEILPKIIGVTFRDRLAPHVGGTLETITLILRPLILLSNSIFKKLISKQESDQITTSDLITMATFARTGKVINLEQENIIVNAIRLSHTQIIHAMIPLDKIQFICKDDTPDTVLSIAKQSGHTRYPISASKDAKDIFAFIIIKKVVPASHEEIKELIKNAKPIHKVNQKDTLMTALKTMLQNKEHLISVINDQGQCVGIVTLEDVASELLAVDIEQFK